jgi:moderate conductance mechanosensitive channel
MEQITEMIGQVSWESMLLSMFRITLILIVAWGLVHAARIGLRRLEATLIERGKQEGEPPSEAVKRAETLIYLLRQAIVIMLWVMALLVILREMGFEIMPVLASAGIVGLAIGFGAQNLVRDVIAGFFIILENQVRVGDVAIVNGTGGLVERINFRTLVLRDLSGVVHIFPNGSIDTLSNMTREWSAFVFDVGVAYKEDTDRVIDVMRGVGEDLKQDDYFGALMLDPPEIFGVDAFADSAVMIKGRIRTRPIKQWEVGREFHRRLKKAFDREGIEIPFPHRSIYFGEASKPVLARLLGERDRDGAGAESAVNKQ